MTNKLTQALSKSKMTKVLATSVMAVSVFAPTISSVSADENKTTCTLTIYASKNTGSNFADATGACKDEVYGYYSPTTKTFRATGMYSGTIVNGQTKEIALGQSNYSAADITFYTVNDLSSSKPTPKPPTTPVSVKKSFKGIALNSTTVWSGTTSKSKKIGTLSNRTVINVKSEKSNRYSFTYKGKKRWIDTSKISTFKSEKKSFKGRAFQTLTIWSGTTSSSKKVGTIYAGTAMNVTSEKADRYSVSYKGKKRWVDKASVSEVFNEYQVQTTAALNVRTGTSTKNKKVGQLKKGTKVIVEGTSNGWYQISYNNKPAFISSKYTKKVTVSTTKKVKTTATLNVRSGRSTKYKVIGKLSKGSTVTVKGTKSGWYTISYKGKTGYISAKYTSK